MKQALRIVGLLGLGLSAAGWAPAQTDAAPRKPGLWEMRIQAEGRRAGQEQVIHQCIDAGSDSMLRDWARGKEEGRCTTYEPRRVGANTVVDAVCKVGRSTATIRTEISGDPSSDFRADTRTTYNPPLRGRAQGHAVMHARWTGPCAPGQKPGEIVLPGGNTLQPRGRP